jgi:hypothetical protein
MPRPRIPEPWELPSPTAPARPDPLAILRGKLEPGQGESPGGRMEKEAAEEQARRARGSRNPPGELKGNLPAIKF